MISTTLRNTVIALAASVAAGSVAWAAVRHTETLESEHRHMAVTREDSGYARLLSIKRPFFETQLRLCVDAADAAAGYATAEDDAVVESARDRFRQLYHGSLVVVEDEAVAEAMTAYRRRMLELDPHSVAQRRELRGLALVIGGACRELVGRSWSVDLPPLREAVN